MTQLRQTAFRLSDSDLAILDEIRASLRLDTRAQALRHVLRNWPRRDKKNGRKR